MVRQFTGDSTSPRGHLIVGDINLNCVEVFYVPDKEKLFQAGLSTNKASACQAKLLSINELGNSITIYPVNTLGISQKLLTPKYKKVMSITLSGFEFATPVDTDGVLDLLENLPSGFIKDYNFGLGLQKDYRFIVDAIEELSNCAEIMIAESILTGIAKNPTIFNISYEDFEAARKSVNLITRRAQEASRSVKSTKIFNLFALLLMVRSNLNGVE